MQLILPWEMLKMVAQQRSPEASKHLMIRKITNSNYQLEATLLCLLGNGGSLMQTLQKDGAFVLQHIRLTCSYIAFSPFADDICNPLKLNQCSADAACDASGSNPYRVG